MKRNNTSQQWCFNCKLKIYYVPSIQITKTIQHIEIERKYFDKCFERMKWKKKGGGESKKITRILYTIFSTCFSSNSHNTLECRLFDFFFSFKNFVNLLTTFSSSYFVYSLWNATCACMCVCVSHEPLFSANNIHRHRQILPPKKGKRD